MNFDLQSDKQYGIMLSGGLDSAVLLSLILLENKDIKIQTFTIAKTDGAYLYADPLIDHLNIKFKSAIPKTIQVGDPTVHHRQQSHTAVKEIFDKHPVDYLFIGINQNPPELANLHGAPQRDTKSSNPRILFPFVDLYKHNILEFMYANNQEDLIDITHSCTEQKIGRCNRCWQCTERAWAFKQLDRQDTGTL